ncbi:MAG: hypothetical protein AAB551_00735 [Patescibacteria group bacterium]
MKKISLIGFLCLLSLTLTGCEQAEKVQADFNQSVENIKKEATAVKEKIEKAKEDVEKTVEKVGNLVDAVKAFGSDEKPEVPAATTPPKTPDTK